MKQHLTFLSLPLLFAVPVAAQEIEMPATPAQAIANAQDSEWRRITPENLLVIDLAPDRDGNARRIVIQLMQAPLSQLWVQNIRTLARAGYWDGSSVNRVQDNYVVQWGQPDEGMVGTMRPVPDGLNVVPEECYEHTMMFGERCGENGVGDEERRAVEIAMNAEIDMESAMEEMEAEAMMGEEIAFSLPVSGHPKGSGAISIMATNSNEHPEGWHERDPYAEWVEFYEGWPLAAREGPKDEDDISQWRFWPTHCYGMVGVGRSLSPDTGDGSQLYAVIGHAPRHLDRNIALVGRVIAGLVHLTSLPRGTGPLGFYESAEEMVPIVSARLAADMGNAPVFEYLDTGSASFENYLALRANRSDDFYTEPAGGVDICNVPVPIRVVSD